MQRNNRTNSLHWKTTKKTVKHNMYHNRANLAHHLGFYEVISRNTSVLSNVHLFSFPLRCYNQTRIPTLHELTMQNQWKWEQHRGSTCILDATFQQACHEKRGSRRTLTELTEFPSSNQNTCPNVQKNESSSWDWTLLSSQASYVHGRLTSHVEWDNRSCIPELWPCRSCSAGGRSDESSHETNYSDPQGS